MSGERFDYRNERQRHEMFVGRRALLAHLDALLVDDGPDRWVVITGGPGMGKSAILSAWLTRREAAGAVVPHHFIRRGAYDWDDPAQLVGSLVAQLDERFPGAREPDPDARMHPAARLAKALSQVSEREIESSGKRLVVMVDGLDEYDPPAGSLPGDPLAAFLPHALPRGVSFLCACRPRHPYLSSLAARDGELVRIDLDAPDRVADNDATVRTFWENAAGPLGLDARFVDEAVARAVGNVQHAVQLRRQVAATPAQLRRVEDIPRGLEALIEQTWERVARDPVVVEGLGILCAAREALTLDELGTVAGWTADAPRRAFLRGAKEVLVEAQRPDGQREYRLHHDAIRAHIAQAIGDAALHGHHRALAGRLATWPALEPSVARRYALRHALIHRAEAGDWADAWRIAGDTSFLETKCRELGAHDLEADVARAAERCRADGHAALGHRFTDLARALVRESHWLRATSEATPALLWNRLRRSGWSEHDLSSQLQVPVDAAFLRVRHTVTRESPALVRDLVGHGAAVTACAVTPDGRRVVSASMDRTPKVWDLDTGRALVTLQGHAGGVNACAVTPDGRRVVSASEDRTLKVWDLETGRVLATLHGEAKGVTACAITPNGRRVVSASRDPTRKVWDLDAGDELASLEGHAGWVTALAMTSDGRRVVSASWDKTLKVWDLDSGRAEPLDLLRELRKLRPTVVHFSGHGGLSPPGAGSRIRTPDRDVIADAGPSDSERPRGLFFQGPDGRAQVVTARALQDTFGAAGSSVRLVVLSACYSDEQAEALRAHVDCVVGMSGSITADAARSFAIGLYGGLGECESIATAFRQGCAAIRLEGLRDVDRPQLKVRDGVDVSTLVLGPR